jgi:hypothetical protein
MRRSRLRRGNKCSPATSISVSSAGCCYNRTLGCITRCNLCRGASLFRPSTASAGFLPPGIFDAMKDSPVAVCGARIEIYLSSETGFCIYDPAPSDDFSVTNSTCAAIEVDFFRADDIANMQNDKEVAGSPSVPSRPLSRSVR